MTRDMNMGDDEFKVIPVYAFADGQDDIEPMKRKITKTMEVTETFTAFDVLQYIGKMDKAIADKQAELDGLVSMKKAYLDEMVEVESQTQVNELEVDFQAKVAESFAEPIVEETEDELAAEPVLEEGIKSPYMEDEVADGETEKNA